MTRRPSSSREALIAQLGTGVARFQEESSAFDDVAARVLAVERGDLPCMTLLLFGGPAPIDRLAAALDRPRSVVVATVDRLEMAGYARRRAGDAGVELTGHAREWIERIWAPLREDGARLLGSYPARDLAMMATFMARARDIQERQLRRLRAWLERPASPARRPHLRGGLSPAALRRVQLFVEANLERPIRLADLAARAGLSAFHFARAFRISTGCPPRVYVEQRRVARAKALIAESARPLAEVAVETGFGTQSRLTTTFRRHTGFTPAAYRRAVS
jgi:AraC family transcriptional regulator